MISPAAGNNSSSEAFTYTTIPISGPDVIQRSIQNLFSSLSRCRPWPEFLSVGALSLPTSFPIAGCRFRLNSKYFLVNYAVVTSACAGLSLIVSPIALIVVGFVLALWLVFFFCREDPMVVMGHNVDDRAVNVGLVLVSAAIASFIGLAALGTLLIGIMFGLLVTIIHGLVRRTEGLYLDEDDSIFFGLISTPQNGEIV